MSNVTDNRRHFDDIALGEVTRLGSVAVTRQMIVDFAREFDPFPFHLDEDAARRSLLGGLSASGWHTAALTMRLLDDAFLGDVALLAGLGITDLKWKRPVMVDDTLTGTSTVAGKRHSESRPDRGILTIALDIRNQRDESVMTMNAANLVARRAAAHAQPEMLYDAQIGAPAMTRWFDDVTLNEPFPLGSHTFTEAEIVRFGRLYDPQYFHTDPEAARHSIFGGLVASGLHVASVGQRQMVDALAAEAERLRAVGEEPGVSGPSPGLPRLQFTHPVRPGDTVTFSLTVNGKRPSGSQAGWGLLFNTISGVNQHGDTVYTGELIAFSRLRG